jgi:hypothetical protein
MDPAVILKGSIDEQNDLFRGSGRESQSMCALES